MTLLDKHIGAHVVWGTMLALLVLLSVFTFTEFVEDLDSVGRGTYSLLRAGEYMVLTLPRRAFELFPVSALIGSLLGLGVLASNSELIVVRAAGVSLARITLSVMKAGALLMVIAIAVGEVLAPIAERLAQERRSVALSNQIALKTGEGFWIRDATSFINIREVLPGQRMADVFIYEFDDGQRLRVATHASTARYEQDQWVLEDITQSVIHEDRVEQRRIEQAVWSSVFEPSLVSVITVRPESLSAIGLLRYLAYLKGNRLSTARYELALWNKLMSPLSTGAMIFLAIPLVLGRLRAVGIGQRVLVGILVGIAFYVLQQTASQMGIVYGLAPILGAAFPTALCLGFGMLLMRQVR